MIQLRRSNIAGEYVGTRQQAQLVLRIDVGADSSLDIISGDLFLETSPGNFEFHHSFRSTGLMVEEIPDGQRLRSAVKVHKKDILDIARIDLTIPDSGELVVIYTFYRLTEFGRQTAAVLTFPLDKQSEFFRRIELEVDRVEGVPLPEAFQTDSHPDTPLSVPPRNLTFQATYRDAGVDMVTTFDPTPVPRSEADAIDADQLWTNEELHAAMVGNFSKHVDEPGWRLYLLLATRYVSPGVLGIMFDSGDNFPRQGAAVFYEHPAIANAVGAEKNREYLFTITHELGHALNLLHAFQKGIFETHGVLPRPASLTYMNYPHLFPFGYAGPPNWNGSTSYWRQFKFQFDREELAHIRHSDSMEVMMGGLSFGFAGHLEERPFESPTSPGNSISLTLWVPPVIEFMQQLEGDIRLRNEGPVTQNVRSNLDLSTDNITLLIRRSLDRYPKVYRNFYHACFQDPMRALKPGEAIYQEIGPSFGLRHWFLDEPGTYELQAIYHAPNGQNLASEIRKVRITYPSKEADRLAPDFFTIDTGTYFGLEGTRTAKESLKKTSEFLSVEVCKRLPDETISKQISLINSLCEMRVFKDVQNRKVTIPDRSLGANNLINTLGVNLAKQTIKRSEDQSNLKLSRILRTAVSAFTATDEKEKAKDVYGTIKTILTDVKAPKQALEELQGFKQQVGI